MCYYLWIASPLSLTEIRSMLPTGFAVEIVPPAEQVPFRARLRSAQSVVRLRVGGCACALGVDEEGGEERHLRRRYAALGLSRDRVIAALEHHRRGAAPAGMPRARRTALAEFVAEHARNAGPTLYYLGFGTEPVEGLASAVGPVATMTAAAVRAAADTWLEEGRLIEVTRNP